MSKVDWGSFISQHDLVYEEAGKVWQDGLPLGNGDLGVLAYAPLSPEFVINKIDVYDHRVPSRKRVLTHEEALEVLRSSPTLTPHGSTEAAAAKIDQLEARAEPLAISPKSCCQLRLAFCRGAAFSNNGPALVGQKLSLHDATLHTSIDRHFCHPRIEAFVASQTNVLCVKVCDVSPISSWRNFVELFYTRDSLTPDPKLDVQGDRMVLDRTMPDGLRYVAMAQVQPRGWSGVYRDWLKENWRPKHHNVEGKAGKPAAKGHVLQTAVTGDFDLFLAVATSDEHADPLAAAAQLLDEAVGKGFDALLAEHRGWWHNFWQKSLVQLEDFGWQQLYYLSLYQAASCYRKAPVPGICGLWLGPSETAEQTAEWNGCYAADQNCQGPVFPLFASNHPELAEGYYDTWLKMLPKARDYARQVYGIEGAHLPAGCGPRGDDLGGGSGKYMLQCSGPYNGLLFAWGYEFTQDKRLLEEKVYPFLRDVLDFYAAYMTLDTSGRYQLYPSQAPELWHMNTTNVTFIISLLKVCFKTGVAAARLLGRDADRRAKWEDILAHYPEYAIGDGMFLEAKEIPSQHYVSCGGGLYPLFPCGEVGPEGDLKLLKAARNTFKAYYDGGLFPMIYGQKPGERRAGGGWPWFFSAMWALRLGNAKQAWEEFIPMLLKACVKPSGLMGHDGVQLCDPARSEAAHALIPDRSILDGDEAMSLRECRGVGCGGISHCTPNPRAKEHQHMALEVNAYYMNVIQECLLQSHDGMIRLFPGVPEGHAARFVELRARGAFLISAELMRTGVSHVKVKSLVGGAVKVKNPWPGKRVYRELGGEVEAGQVIELTLQPDEEVCLAADKKVFARLNTETIAGTMAARPRPLIEDGDYTVWLGKPLLHPAMTRWAQQLEKS